jgi:hypothetical protein
MSAVPSLNMSKVKPALEAEEGGSRRRAADPAAASGFLANVQRVLFVCPHTAAYVCAYYCIRVLSIVRILLRMCPHTAAVVSARCCMCADTTMCVSCQHYAASYYRIRQNAHNISACHAALHRRCGFIYNSQYCNVICMMIRYKKTLPLRAGALDRCLCLSVCLCVLYISVSVSVSVCLCILYIERSGARSVCKRAV